MDLEYSSGNGGSTPTANVAGLETRFYWEIVEENIKLEATRIRNGRVAEVYEKVSIDDSALGGMTARCSYNVPTDATEPTFTRSSFIPVSNNSFYVYFTADDWLETITLRHRFDGSGGYTDTSMTYDAPTRRYYAQVSLSTSEDIVNLHEIV